MAGDKFEELILYLARASEGDPNFGSIKLNKLLFYTDLYAFGWRGKPVTGQKYQRLPKGPAPKGLVPCTERMKLSGSCAWQERIAPGGYIQRRLVALREPNLDVLTGTEIKQADEVLRVFREYNARDISEDSHELVGWRAAEDGEIIPLETAFVSRRELTQAEKDHALTL